MTSRVPRAHYLGWIGLLKLEIVLDLQTRPLLLVDQADRAHSHLATGSNDSHKLHVGSSLAGPIHRGEIHRTVEVHGELHVLGGTARELVREGQGLLVLGGVQGDFIRDDGFRFLRGHLPSGRVRFGSLMHR